VDLPQPTPPHSKLQQPLTKLYEGTLEVVLEALEALEALEVLEVLEVLEPLEAPQDNQPNNRMWYHKPQTYALWEAYPLSSQATGLRLKISSMEYKPTYASIERSRALPYL